MTNKINLEYPNISLRQYPKKSDNLFSIESCQVAVNYWIYDKKKKIIVDAGSSRACGCNYHKSSIHAEQRALEYLRKKFTIEHQNLSFNNDRKTAESFYIHFNILLFFFPLISI